MKNKNYFKKLSLALLMLVGFTNFVNAQVPAYVPSNGLVVCYPFTGNANDQSGNSHNGTVTGATLTTDRFGNANSAYFFNGTSSYIYAGNIASLAGTPSSVTTVSLWMNSNSLLTSNSDLFDLRSTNNSALELYYNIPTAGKIQGINYNAPTPNNGIYTTGANTLSINQWYHVVYILNNATGHSTLYVNGVQVGDVIGTPALLTNPKLNIGSRFDFYNSRCCYFKGAIDDVCFWNRALTSNEITTMYNGVPAYSDNCNAVSGSLTQGLVAYYPFCGNANDDSGHGNNGTVNGATLTTDRFGNANAAYNFNGINNFISTTCPGVLGTNSRSISFWFNSTSNNTNETVFTDYGGSNCGQGFACTLFPQNKPGADNSCSTINSNNSSSLNSWNFYTVTYSSTDGTNITNCKLYINGILQITTQNTTQYPINTTNVVNLVFGSSRLYNSIQYFQGKLDDIGIWNRALTTSEVTQLYNQNQCFTNTTVTDTLVINVGQLSYTDPITYANKITIFPNPASTQVNISFNNISDLNGGAIKIINSLGQQVATTPITTSGTNTTMTLNSWGGAGLYFVQIVNPQGQIVDIKKIILQ